MIIGRNAPCTCGSGKKYKKCCLGKESKSKAEDYKEVKQGNPYNSDMSHSFIECDIDELSNSVIDLIESKDYDKAKETCRKLQEEYPDQIDGIERFSSVYEAEGNIEKAVEYYLKTVEFMRNNPGFDDEGIKFYEEKALELGKEGK